MMRLSLVTLAVLTLLPIAGTLYAQDTAPAPAPAPAPAAAEKPALPIAKEPPAVKPGPQLLEFQKRFEEWKNFLTELRTLKTEYVSATDEEKKEIKAKYEKLVEKATALQPKLIEAAEKAYLENPKADPQLLQYLNAACIDNFRMDNYEESYRLAKMMIDHGEKTKLTELFGGASAFCIGKLNEAEELLKSLKKQGVAIRTMESKGTLDALLNQFLEEPSTFKKAWAAEQKIRAQEAKADDLPRVKLKTTAGDIIIELFENEAPNTVANFISLVEKGFYDGLSFHRVLDAFMAQGGCPNGDGMGGPGYKIPCECIRKDFRKHFRGSLSMAHAGKDTGGSQFFITFVPTSFLDKGNPNEHTVFGRVVDGMETLSKIHRRDPSKMGGVAPPSKIIKAEVIRKRDHEYKPKKVGDK